MIIKPVNKNAKNLCRVTLDLHSDSQSANIQILDLKSLALIWKKPQRQLRFFFFQVLMIEIAPPQKDRLMVVGFTDFAATIRLRTG